MEETKLCVEAMTGVEFSVPDAVYLFEQLSWLKWAVAAGFFLMGVSSQWRARVEPNEMSDSELQIGPASDPVPDRVDDLTLIRGIDKAMGSKLNAVGVYRFEQIAGWDQSEVAEMAKKLKLTDQIERSGWVSQAKAFQESAGTDEQA